MLLNDGSCAITLAATAWLEGATDSDIHAIKKSMEKTPLRALHFWILELLFLL
jgi:hypothetical protein